MNNTDPQKILPTFGKNTGIVIVLSAIIGLACYYTYKNIEWAEKKVNIGWSEKARINPFLAAQSFLNKSGLEADVIRSFDYLNDLSKGPIKFDDTIVLVNAYGGLTTTQYENVVTWLSAGGTLITSSSNIYSNVRKIEDKLFKQFGIDIQKDYDSNKEKDADVFFIEKIKEAAEPEDDKAGVCPAYPDHSYYINEDEGSVAHPAWGPPLIIDKDDDIFGWRSSDRGVELAFLDVGDNGMLYITTGNTLWNNFAIDDYDNAYLLWLISKSSNKVWFLINQKSASLISRLWDFSPISILAFCAACLLWFWRKSRKVGPTLTVDRSSRRQFLEHVQSSAELLWRNNQRVFMLNRIKKDTLSKIHRNYPHLKKLNEQQQTEKLANILNLPKKIIQFIYYEETNLTERRFLEHVNKIQLIREKL